MHKETRVEFKGFRRWCIWIGNESGDKRGNFELYLSKYGDDGDDVCPAMRTTKFGTAMVRATM